MRAEVFLQQPERKPAEQGDDREPRQRLRPRVRVVARVGRASAPPCPAIAFSRPLKITTARAGARVRAFTAEMSMAVAMVRANWR